MKFSKAIRLFNEMVLLLFIVAAQETRAQSPSTEDIEIQKADFRGQRPQGAFIAAASASSQDVVVVIVEGGDEKLIAETEGNLRALARNSYTRLGLILCDRLPDSTAPAVIVVSGGLTYAIVHDAKADAKTSSDVYKLIRDAYIEDIIPKLKSKASPANGGGE
jgi:hypothetical protein